MEYNEKELTTRLHAESLIELQQDYPSIQKIDFPLILTLHLVSILGDLKQGSHALEPLIQEVAQSTILKTPERWKVNNDLKAQISETIHSLKKSTLINDMVLVANYLFDLVLTRRYGIHRTHPRITATLASAIYDNGTSGPLVDVVPSTAELSIKHSPGTRLNTMIIGPAIGKAEQSLLKLKLRLSNLAPSNVSNDEFSDPVFDRATFFIDHPHTNPDDLQSSEPAATVEKLFNSISHPCQLIIITPISKQIPRIQKILLKWKHIQLDAVINFSSSRHPSTTVDRSALVLSLGLKKRDTTVYIDVSSKNRSLPTLTKTDRVILAAKIFHLHQNSLKKSLKLESKPIQQFLNTHFSSGYTNLKHTCISVPKDTSQPIKLRSARSLLIQHSRESGAIFKTANLDNLTGLINTKSAANCVFIIGNNGAGKSMLLRELATQLTESGTTVVGISTTIQDRFNFSEKHRQANRFIYKGVRTSPNNISLLHLDKSAHLQTAEIFRRQEKLDAMVKCLSHLGYAPRFYLMKKKVVDDDSTASENFKALSLTSSENNIPTNLDDYELGVVRKGEKAVVRSFSSLSSGEQNINHLLFNIISSTEADRVFLIDEPEISLHLQWQQSLPHVLHILSKQFGVSFVVATHSPTLITNANDENMHCFQLHDGKLRLLNDDERYSVESIILEGFKTYTPNNRGVHEKCAKLVAQTIKEKNTPHLPLESKALTELEELERLILKTGGKSPSSGMKDDLDLIKKAQTAITLLLQDDAVTA